MKVMPLIPQTIPARERDDQRFPICTALTSETDRIYGMNWIGFLISRIQAILLILSDPSSQLATRHISHVTFLAIAHSGAPAPKGEPSGERDSIGTAEALDQGG